MCDPLSDDIVNLKKFKKPTGPEDWAYSSERFEMISTPKLVFIPNKLMMLKMMRSCIQVLDEKDLWFNI